MRFEFEDASGGRHVLRTVGRPRGKVWPAQLDGAMVALWVVRWIDTRGRLAVYRGGGLEFALVASMFGRRWRAICASREFPGVEEIEEPVPGEGAPGPLNEFVTPFGTFAALSRAGWRAPPGLEVPEDVRRMVEFSRRLHESAPTAWVTGAIVVANVLVFGAMTALGAGFFLPTPEDALAWGAGSGVTVTSGQWWRLFTSMFVHFGIVHLAFNMLVLMEAGPFLERLVGRAAYAVLYVLSGLAGSLASVGWHPYGVGAGASGAVFGVYGALLAVLIRRRGEIPAPALAPMRRGVVLFVVMNLGISLALPFISFAAHAGGLAAGFLAGLVMSGGFTAGARASQRRRVPVVAVLGLAGIVGLVAAMPKVVAGAEWSRLEQSLLADYGARLERLERGETTAPEVAAWIEEGALPPWREAVGQMERMRHEAAVKGPLIEYARVRGEWWALVAKSLRTGDPADAAAAEAKSGELQRIIDRLKEGAR